MQRYLTTAALVLGLFWVGTVPAAGADTTECALAGDITQDGAVNAADAIAIRRYNAGLSIPDDAKPACGDMNGDGEIHVNDAMLVLYQRAGLLG